MILKLVFMIIYLADAVGFEFKNTILKTNY